MGIVDTVICLSLVPAIVIGLFKGCIKQLIALLVVYLGITLSIHFADTVSTWLMGYFTTKPIYLKIISFIIIWTVVAILLNILGKLLGKVLNISMLGWLDHLLGGIVAIPIAIFLLSLFVTILDALNGVFGFLPQKEMAESQLYLTLLDAAKTIFPHLRQLF